MHALRRALLWRRPLPQPPAAAPPRPLLSPRACLRSTRRVSLARDKLFFAAVHKPTMTCTSPQQRLGLACSTKSTSCRPPRRPPGGFRPDREFRGRRQPNRETLHNMPIIRQEGKPSHLNQPGRHAHGCISGRQKQQRGYMLYAQDVTARRRLKPRVCRPRSRSCATPAQIRPPRSAHAPVPRDTVLALRRSHY